MLLQKEIVNFAKSNQKTIKMKKKSAILSFLLMALMVLLPLQGEAQSITRGKKQQTTTKTSTTKKKKDEKSSSKNKSTTKNKSKHNTSTSNVNPKVVHEYVDLGLSVKWATCNIGANSPEEYGDYYAWGETSTKHSYDKENYRWYREGNCELPGGLSDISGSDFDVAHAKWGGKWRLPTLVEIKELTECCTSTHTTINGVEGRRITGPNGNSIFIPSGGYIGEMTKPSFLGHLGMIRSSQKSVTKDNWAWYIFLSPEKLSMSYDIPRYYGLNVRPVCE